MTLRKNGWAIGFAAAQAIAQAIVLSLVLALSVVFAPIPVAFANEIGAVSSNPDSLAQLEPSAAVEVEPLNPSRSLAQAPFYGGWGMGTNTGWGWNQPPYFNNWGTGFGNGQEFPNPNYQVPNPQKYASPVNPPGVYSQPLNGRQRKEEESSPCDDEPQVRACGQCRVRDQNGIWRAGLWFNQRLGICRICGG